MTALEYLKLPDDGCRHELIHGELVMSPSPVYDHGAVVAFLASKLVTHVLSRGLGSVTVETDIVMGKNLVLRPDIAYVSRKRASIIRGHLYGPPDLVIEVTSPGNWQMDVFAKRHDYERFGVKEYWIFDIVDGRHKVYQWCLRGRKFDGGVLKATVLRASVLKGFSLKLGDVWALSKS